MPLPDNVVYVHTRVFTYNGKESTLSSCSRATLDYFRKKEDTLLSLMHEDTQNPNFDIFSM